MESLNKGHSGTIIIIGLACRKGCPSWKFSVYVNYRTVTLGPRAVSFIERCNNQGRQKGLKGGEAYLRLCKSTEKIMHTHNSGF